MPHSPSAPSPEQTGPAVASLPVEAAPTVEADPDDFHASALLLIGEEPVSLNMLATFLKNSGYSHVASLQEPWRVLDVIEQSQPDVILIDLKETNLAALAPLEAIRSLPEMRHAPAILMSASADEEMRLRAIELGADIYLFKPVNPRELLLRLRNALSLISYHDHLAHYDILTGLPNRALFLQHLEDALGKHASSGQAALLHVNLDRFKQINEGLGHKIGDALLRAVAERLDGILRSGDTLSRGDAAKQGQSLSHLGSDEFTILSVRLRHPDDAGIIARRIIDAMSQPFKLAGRELYVTSSIGIAIYPDDGEDASSLLKHAVLAMDQAKKSGGNSFEFFSSQLNQRSLERLSLENALRNAVKHNELRLLYQPKIDSSSGRLVGVEALMRWVHPTLGMLGPHRFISVAEDSGLIIELGRWALQTACRQAVEWEQQGLSGMHMAVNLSSIQFRQGRLVETIEEVLRETGLAPARLILELTESCIMTNVEANIDIMKMLKTLGVQLSVDDFGTGFSSLSYLQRFPLDELKVDRSFIQGLGSGEKGQALVAGIISLADGLKLRTVAEGIETTAQFQQIRDMGCKYCQGYLFSKPVSAAEIVEFHARARGDG